MYITVMRPPITGRNRGLNRCGSSPAWQKRCVQIQTGDFWNLEHRARQDLAVSNDNDYVRRERANLIDRFAILDSRRLQSLSRPAFGPPAISAFLIGGAVIFCSRPPVYPVA